MNFARAIPKIDLDHTQLIRIFTIIPAVLIVLAGAGAIWMYFFVLSLLPEGRSLVETPGLGSNVSVIRDGNGIPGIVGETQDDVALVLGYVMAQDRLWQMDYLRRAGQGRLAEVLGPNYLEGDHLQRTLTVVRRRNEARFNLTDLEINWLSKFVQGINRYISTHEGKLPVEFSILEYTPEFFAKEDVLSILDALAWDSSLALRIDPLMTSMLGRLGKERALELFPNDPAASRPDVSSDLAGWEPTGPLFSNPAAGYTFSRVSGFRGGSGWAVGPRRSRSGKALTGCCMYQPQTAPGFWYRARLFAKDFQLSGAFIPGVPLVMAGSNQRLSWACISSPVDDADLYIERLDSDEAKGYFRIDRLMKTEEAHERYRVRGASSISRPILLTDLGPIVSDVNKSRALSLRWTGQHGLGLFSALFGGNRAADGNQLRSAMRALIAPCLNVVWADEQSDFGIQLAGRLPIRPPGSDGIVPLPAWTGTYDWMGFIPFKELPSETNPAPGIAVVADGRPGGPDYPFFVSCYWNGANRHGRIKELLDSSKEHSLESFSTIQTDTLSPVAARLAPILVSAVEKSSQLDSAGSEALQILGGWDFQMNKESAGGAIFGLAYQSLVESTLKKPLGNELYSGYTSHPAIASRVIQKFFVDGKTGVTEKNDSDSALVDSFRKGVERGKALIGDRPARWKWGEIHATMFRHPVSARSRFLEALYHVGPFPTSGSWDTINYSGWSMAHPFWVTDGVSLRQYTDMGQPPLVFAVSPLGSSAHFFSAHYKDQTSAWLTGRSLLDPLHLADISKEAGNTVIFKPSGPGPVSLKQ